MNSVVTAYPEPLPQATSTSLSLPESLTFEQWEEIGAELANRARKLNWWIGDWWAAGHHRYGERARLAARGLFGKEFKTLANIASVCRAFEPTRRREHLSWSHHAEAAALSPNAADMLLDLAERDRLSKAQVRAAVTTIRGGPVTRTSPDEAAVANLFRAYNRLPGEVRVLVAQAFAAVAVTGAEIDPTTGNPRDDGPLDDAGSVLDEPEALDPAHDIESAPAVIADDIEYDLTLDMAASQAQPESETPLELAAEMEAAPATAGPDTALDLDLDMAVPSDTETETTFDLEKVMEEEQAPAGFDTALDLGPEMEEAEEADKKAPANEPWLLP